MLLLYRVQTKFGVIINKLLISLKYKKSKEKNKFAHISYYAVGNAGDTVLSECVRKTFNKEYESSSWKLIGVSHVVNNKLIRRINSTNGLIIGGGGLFLPDTNGNSISGWQWACSKSLLDKIEVPIILFSVGYNYFRGQKPSSLFIENLNQIIRKSRFIGLRNTGSVIAVKQLVETELQGKIIFQPCTTTIIRKIYPTLPKKRERKTVCFNIAFDRSKMRFGENKDQILNQISSAIDIIRVKGYKVYIIAHCPKDLTILPYVKNINAVNVVNASYWRFGRLVNFYNNMDVVIGMRGHAQMIPFGCNCHIISLGSHEKMKWFLQDIDAEDWYIEITEDISQLSRKIVTLFEEVHEKNGKETTRRLLKAQDELYQITCDNMIKIKKILKGENP